MVMVIASALKALVAPISTIISLGPSSIGLTPRIASTSRYSPFDMKERRLDADPVKWPCRANNSESSTRPLCLSFEGMESEYEFRFRHQLLDPRL